MLLLVLGPLLFSCNPPKSSDGYTTIAPNIEGQQESPIAGETEFQRSLNRLYKDPEQSPLKPQDRIAFKGLDFFPYDSALRVEARLIKAESEGASLILKTNTERSPTFIHYATAVFRIQGKEHRLELYQDPELMENPAFLDYLFLPFTDESNGEETYGGGRYLDLSKPKDDRLWIDFNEAYNPYCVYNEVYSCPVPPRANHLPIKILAGVKDFKRS